MGKPRGGSVHRVLVEDEHHEGMLTKNITQERVQAAIFDNIHRKRFFSQKTPQYVQGCFGVSLGITPSLKQPRQY
jgi:hypothetical protein